MRLSAFSMLMGCSSLPCRSSSKREEIGDASAMLGGGAEQVCAALRALHEELDVALPGEAHPAVNLDGFLGDERLAFAGSGLRHGGGERAARVVLGDRHHRED